MVKIKPVIIFLLNSVLTGFTVGSINDNVHRQIAEYFDMDPEVHMNAAELITSKGYPCEEYSVVTDDGFVLGVQRIPHGLSEKSAIKDDPKPVVFLQHGLLCSSTNWITNLANESLAFILADAGFDVWLGNIRGNTYSRKHIHFTPDENRFWSWSWDQMAEYDVPAMIDFALNKTDQRNLYYVGHSQGTLIMFAQLSKNPAFAQKIKTFFALGPVTTVQHISGPLKYLAYFTKELSALVEIFGVQDFLPNNAIIKLLSTFFCKKSTLPVCENMLFLIAGFDQQQLNASRVPVYLSHTPAGTSVRNMIHFAQMVRSGQFQMYDYGSAHRNYEHYGQSTPPLYDARNVTVPVALFSAQNDILADPEDVESLAAQLPNIITHQKIPQWDHLDFVWGLDAPSVLYDNMIKMMKKL